MPTVPTGRSVPTMSMPPDCESVPAVMTCLAAAICETPSAPMLPMLMRLPPPPVIERVCRPDEKILLLKGFGPAPMPFTLMLSAPLAVTVWSPGVKFTISATPPLDRTRTSTAAPLPLVEIVWLPLPMCSIAARRKSCAVTPTDCAVMVWPPLERTIASCVPPALTFECAGGGDLLLAERAGDLGQRAGRGHADRTCSDCLVRALDRRGGARNDDATRGHCRSTGDGQVAGDVEGHRAAARHGMRDVEAGACAIGRDVHRAAGGGSLEISTSRCC